MKLQRLLAATSNHPAYNFDYLVCPSWFAEIEFDWLKVITWPEVVATVLHGLLSDFLPLLKQ